MIQNRTNPEPGFFVEKQYRTDSAVFLESPADCTVTRESIPHIPKQKLGNLCRVELENWLRFGKFQTRSTQVVVVRGSV
jgi:hypothetical protein